MRLQNKTALITGGSRGVGRAAAERFIAEGAKVYITDVVADRGETTAAEIGATFIQQNVAEEADWQRVVATLEADGVDLNILVNNAAILQFGNIDMESLEGWRRLMAVNSDGVFLAIKYMLPLLEKAGGGSIINMSSSSALMGVPDFCAYTASKSAVRGLTMSTAVLCKQRANKVRCNSIHPDGINTDMVREIAGQANSHDPDQYKNSAPFLCQPEDVANVIFFLASDDSRHVNGIALSVDNTSTIHPPYL
ncbi:SDR family oxidoreductase [Aequoribacter sp.]|uniref:SDR family oxidoreductase n=1 Tax=Aequoribacter sp. TaxID=2847771 RepID=UPI003F69DB05